MPLNKNASGLSLAGIALAALMSVALPVSAFAQDTPRSRGDTPRVEAGAESDADTSAPQLEYSISIPTIDAVESSIDQDTIRSILTGNLAEHAGELANLNAKSISIPEITVEYSIPGSENAQASTVTYRDIALNDVTNGVASSAVIGSIDVDAGKEGSFKFGKTSTGTFDLAGLLAFYGLTPGASPDQPLKTIYANFRMEGGSFTSKEADCTIGTIEGEGFKARPLKTPFSELMNIVGELEAQGEDAAPSPEQMGKLVSFYADFLSAFESSPMTFAGLQCKVTAENDKPADISVGPMTIGAFANNVYPEITASDIKVNVQDDGYFNLANVVFKSFDFSSAIAALQEADGAIDDAWLEANGRRLIPAFGGFSFSGLDMDVPDEETPGERIKAAIGSFDLTLGNYVNGIPADISSNAKGIVIALPADSEDEGVQQLLTLGIDKIEAGYDLAASWDQANGNIAIKNIAFDGLNLGALALAGTIGNATEDLFSADNNAALMAAMGLTVKDAKIDVTDAGLAGIMFQKTATEQGQTVEQVRNAMSGIAAGTALAFLGGSAEAQQVSAAIASFIKGDAKSLSITATAKNEDGLGLPEMMELQSNPLALSDHLSLSATAK